MPSIDFDDLLAQADRLRDNAEIDEAINAYKEIAQLATDAHETYFKARAWHLAGVSAKAAVINIDSSYYRDALNFFAQAEALYITLSDQTLLGALYRDIAICGDYAGDSQTAVNYFQKAIEVLEPTESYGELAITYDKLGLHFSKLGQPQEGLAFIDKALQLLKKEPTAGFYRATTLFDGAKIQIRLGNFDRALELAEESLGWFEADHPNRDYARRRAQLFGVLAAIKNELGEQKAAEQYYQKYQELLKNFDPLAVKVIEKDLQFLAS